MPEIDVVLEVPVPASVRAHPKARRHEGVLLAPVTVRMERIDPRPVGKWGRYEFETDGERPFVRPTPPGHRGGGSGPLLFRVGRTPSGHDAVVPGAIVPTEIAETLSVRVDERNMSRFVGVVRGRTHFVTAYGAGIVASEFATSHPTGVLTVGEPDVDAIRDVAARHLAVDADGRFLCRAPWPGTVVTSSFRVEPSVDGYRDDLREGETVLVRGPTPERFGAGPGRAPGRPPDAGRRARIVHALGSDLVRFPDDALDLYTALRPAIRGADDVEGTDALVRLLGAWRPHMSPEDGGRCDVLLGEVARLRVTLDRRAEVDAVLDAFHPSP